MAASIFARIGAIKGESQDAKHKDQIEVESWSWGLSQSGGLSQGGGGGAGKVTFNNLSFTHHVDRATPLLMRACATGEHIKDATITVRRAGRGTVDYLVVTMSDVLVRSVSTGVGEDGAVEVVELAFAKVDLEYKPQKPDGSAEAGVHFKFDLKANKVG